MMAMSKSEIISTSNFGSRVAEDEVESLEEYFVETEQWRKLLAGEVDVVFGDKGTGKSALYSLLVSRKDELRLGRRTLFLAAENPRGTPAFSDLVFSPPATEDQFRGLWKLYFLCIVANYTRHHTQTQKIGNVKAAGVIDILVKNGLLAPDINLLGRLKSVLAYIRKHLPIFEGAVVDPNTGLELKGKITLAEPSEEQRNNGFLSVDNLLFDLNIALQELRIKIWLALDRLDVAFSDSPELEGNALRSLFRVYLDMRALSNISIKIFLRDDIWKKIISEGFREASHITRSIVISWNNQSLLNLVVRRLVHNESICRYYNVTKEQVLRNASLQREFFYRVFPEQIDVGPKQPDTLDWMLSRTSDGSKKTAPRELIHLLSETRDEQLKSYELGNAEPPAETLFSRLAITQALPAVSKARYDQTLCAEQPALKPYLDKLEFGKTQQTRETLAKIWKCPVDRAQEIAENLADSGFFERRTAKGTQVYWVPFIYRVKLKMVQGAAQ